MNNKQQITWIGTKEEFNNLSEYSNDILYFITEETENNDNLKIDGKDVTKIIIVLKYVNINFSENNTKQVPGSILEVPFIDISNTKSDNDYKYYKVLYSWHHLGVDAPLLVPNVDTTYEANWCNIKATNSNITLTVDEYGHQFQSPSFYIISDEPLYFIGATNDGAIQKDVKVNSVITNDEDNKYKMSLTIYINGVILTPGTPKNFVVKLLIYKDYSCSKYIGSININVTMIKPSGPGE